LGLQPPGKISKQRIARSIAKEGESVRVIFIDKGLEWEGEIYNVVSIVDENEGR
jgi:hypothetical protein